MKHVEKKRAGKLDTFWQLFAAFVFSMNESGTYRETAERVRHFVAEQKILKRTPESATPDNACMIRFARKIFSARPKEKPWCLYDYRRLLIKNLYYHSCWLQDNLHLLHGETGIYNVMILFDSILPKRFQQINAEASNIERIAAESVATAKAGFDPRNIDTLDSFRLEHPDAFHRLQAFLVDGCPQPSANAQDAVLCAAHVRTDERFTWYGKDIADYLAELAEAECVRLNFKHELFEKEIERDGAMRWKDMNCHVSKIEQCDADAPVQDMNKEKNHYIEGDNLRALHLLKRQYTEGIKMIYIDPPYNTGNKFIYKDDFKSDDAIYRRLLFARFPMVRECGDNEN